LWLYECLQQQGDKQKTTPSKFENNNLHNMRCWENKATNSINQDANS